MSETKLTVGSMFSGIGGICLGFEQAGFKLVWANEYDAKACITYRENFNHKLIEGDVHGVLNPVEDAGIVDVITSGFPCQAFSVAGYRKGFNDPRGNLFFETARFIDEIKPKAFLLENVKNLAHHDHGKTIKVIEDTVRNELNYSFIPFILDADEYGNIPQCRARVYIVGFRGEGGYTHSPGRRKGETTVFDNKELYRCSNEFNVPQKIDLTVSPWDLIEDEKKPDKYYYKDNHMYFTRLSEAMHNPKSIYQWRRIYVRENKSGVCPTLTANMGTGGHNVPIIRDRYGIRKLTPRECFSFQGFPKSYRLPPINDAALYKQAGNAVVVPVIKRIAEEIRRVLELNQTRI